MYEYIIHSSFDGIDLLEGRLSEHNFSRCLIYPLIFQQLLHGRSLFRVHVKHSHQQTFKFSAHLSPSSCGMYLEKVVITLLVTHAQLLVEDVLVYASLHKGRVLEHEYKEHYSQCKYINFIKFN